MFKEIRRVLVCAFARDASMIKPRLYCTLLTKTVDHLFHAVLTLSGISPLRLSPARRCSSKEGGTAGAPKGAQACRDVGCHRRPIYAFKGDTKALCCPIHRYTEHAKSYRSSSTEAAEKKKLRHRILKRQRYRTKFAAAWPAAGYRCKKCNPTCEGVHRYQAHTTVAALQNLCFF